MNIAWEQWEYDPLSGSIYMADYQRTNYFKTKALRELHGLKWKVPNISGFNELIIRDGKLYTTAGLRVVDIADGTLLKTFDPPQMAGMLESPPVFYKDYVIVTGSFSFLFLDPVTLEKKNQYFIGWDNGNVTLAIDGNLAFIGTKDLKDEPVGQMLAIDLEKLEVAWASKTYWAGFSGSATAVSDGLVYFCGCNGYYCFNAVNPQRNKDGEAIENWSFKKGTGAISYKNGKDHSPVIYKDKVYATTRDGLYELDKKTGKVLWEYHMPPFKGKPIHEIMSNPTVANGKLYLAILDRTAINLPYNEFGRGYIVEIDLKTKKVTKFMCNDDEVILGVDLPMAENVLYCTIYNIKEKSDYVVAFDVSLKKELWRYQLQTYSAINPLIHDGVVYITDTNGFLYALY